MEQTFKLRRARFFEQLKENSIAILVAAPQLMRNGDTAFRYRQNSHFYYLTGFKEPESAALFIKKNGQLQFGLLNRPHDPDQAKWVGEFAGQEGALNTFGADFSFSIFDLDQQMPNFLKDLETLYHHYGQDHHFDQRLNGWLESAGANPRAGNSAPNETINVDAILNELRVIKDESEIALLKKSADIAVSAFKNVMKKARPNLYEYELEAELMKGFYQKGARHESFPSIVAAGEHGCTLHYDQNDGKITDGDLVLVDAGCEYHYYASDITRTFPANGVFSDEQKAIYQIVLDAQMAAIETVKPGNSWHLAQDVAVRVITEGLVKLDILKGEVDDLIKKGAYKDFYLHHIGHFLGLDAHDVGLYYKEGDWIKLEPNMVLTIEPGIYIPSDAKNIDPKWHGIGIRIEDDVLVTKTGHEVLTKSLIKTISDIEAFMRCE